jgi:hypothetical protein
MNEEQAAQSPDETLRLSMHHAVATHDARALDALHGRVIAQWEMRTARHVVGNGGRAAALMSGLRSRRLQWSVMALVLALGLQGLRTASEPSLDDLLEPDVLSLMALGEL